VLTRTHKRNCLPCRVTARKNRNYIKKGEIKEKEEAKKRGLAKSEALPNAKVAKPSRGGGE